MIHVRDERSEHAPGMRAAPLLEVNGLSITFQTREGPIVAAEQIDLVVHEGETVGLVGESGSGKTASVLGMLGLLPPTAKVEGSVRFSGVDLLSLRRRRLNEIRGAQVGIVFQDPLSTLNPVLSIGRQIGETLRAHQGLGRRAAEREAVSLLEMVEIPDARRRIAEYPHQFSGGMRQRATIAMALACRPKFLIADEPTTALDVTVQAQILDLLDRLRREFGMAMLLITHDLGVVAGSAETISVMYAGRIVETGTVKEVFERPRHPYTDGLLKAIPELGVPKFVRLPTIPGQPPPHALSGDACPFAPRCPHVFERCTAESPPLLKLSYTRASACWLEDTRGTNR
jgi:oligopeptide transport system ATP-binding protein